MSPRMEDEKPTWKSRLRLLWWLVGLGALAAWFAVLWLMFGDVL
jgi:hypothetical protein